MLTDFICIPGPSPEATPEARSWRNAVNEGLRSLSLLGMVLIVLFTVIPLHGQPMFNAPSARIGFWLLVACELAATAALALRIYSRAVLAALLVTLLTSTLLMVPHRDEIFPSDLWAPGMCAVPLMGLALIVLERREHARWFIPSALALAAVEATGALYWDYDALRIADEVFVWQPLITLLVFGGGLARLASRHDRTAAQARATRISQAAQRAETEARREAARLLHDHVLHALHAVGEDRTLVTSAQAAGECADTLEQLEPRQEPGAPVKLGILLDEDPVLQRVAGSVHGDSQPLPGAVAAGLAAATHEAVVNVERHAHAHSCRVEVENLGQDGCRVRITDDGRGFDPARRPRGRLGLQRSVLERMDDVGGMARITSSPGRGTTVELSWPRGSFEQGTTRLASWSDAATRRFMMHAALPGMVACLLLMILLANRMPHPAAAVTTSLVALGIGAWNAARITVHGLSDRALAVMLAAAGVAWLVNLQSVTVGHSSVYELWMAWGATALVQLGMLARPRRTAQLLGIGLIAALAGGVICRFGLTAAWMHQSGTVVAGLIVVVVGYHSMFAAQGIVDQAEAQGSAVEATHQAVARMHHLAQLDQFWSDRITRGALPLIADVAEGRLDPADDQVRERARSMESLVRDELVLGPGQQQLGERLHRLRSEGWLVQSSLSRDDSPPVLSTAGKLVTLLGAPAFPGQQITLSSVGGAVTAVVLDPAAVQIRAWRSTIGDLGGNMYDDPDFVRMALVAA